MNARSPWALLSLPLPLFTYFALLLGCVSLNAQNNQPQANPPQALAFAGLRSSSAHGVFHSVRSDGSGNLYLLFDQGDGIRVLKTDSAASAVLEQTKIGAAGDVGLALELDPSGDVYVTGTTTSGMLAATSGAAFTTPAGSGVNSFVARFDSDLNPVFVSFAGGGMLSATALAVTADAVFLTGTIFSNTLPVTTGALQQAPSPGTTENGFVERFSSDGRALVYATYLGGPMGNTAPSALAVDSSDNVYVVGSTSAPGFPTANAFVPVLLGSSSGFLSRVTAAGDSLVFSTFIPGSGMTAVSLSPGEPSLFVSGSVDLGSFPVETVYGPIAQLSYQSLLEFSLDGSSVLSSTLLAPGSESVLAAGSADEVWIGQSLSTPLLPFATLASIGDGLILRRTAQNTIDQAARVGGLPDSNLTFASLPLNLNSLLLSPAGVLFAAGSIEPTASSSLLGTETYDLPLTAATAALPSTIREAETSSSVCSGSLCAGSAGYLAALNPGSSVAALIFSPDDAPLVTLRNLGFADASLLQLSATGASLTSNCPSTLLSGAECSVLLSGSGPATLTATTFSGAAASVSAPSYPQAATTIVFSPKELDFGLQTSGSPAAQRTFTVSNLGSAAQNFKSMSPTPAFAGSPVFTEVSSDCPVAGDNTLKSLAAGAACHITLGFTASANSAFDGAVQQLWSVGSRQVLLTAYSQAAALSVSSPEINFGTKYPGSPGLPRFLHLSNASSFAIAHSAVTLPASSLFTLADNCPSVLGAQTACTLRLDYLAPFSPSNDSVTLNLDQGLSVLILGESLPQPSGAASLSNPSLSFTPASVRFPNPVAVTGSSSDVETVAVTNSGSAPFALSVALTGDYTEQTSCPASLPAGQTCAIALTFVPSQPGIRPGLLTITAGTGYSPVYIPLSGTGLAILSAGNGTLDFGASMSGEPVTQFYKITQPFTSLTASTSGPFTAALIPDLGFGPGEPKASAFLPSTTQPCPQCYLGVRFNPSGSGYHVGSLTLSSGSGTPYTVALTGQGLPNTGLLLTPLNPGFGSVPVNSSGAPLLLILTNLLPAAAPITVDPPTLSGDFVFNPLPTGGAPCNGLLAYEASCFISVNFAPTAAGTRTGSVAVHTSGGDVTATLSGFGTPDPGLAFHPNAVVFNNVPGSSATTQTLTLTNTGPAPILISSASVTTTSFAVASQCGALAPNASCTITITFTPSGATVNDTLTLTVTAGTTTAYAVPLTGAYTRSSAGFNLLPAQVDYGPAAIGTEGTGRQFTLLNLTASMLTLNVILPRQSALTGPPCISLEPSGACTFTVVFLPQTSAAITGSVRVQASTADGSISYSNIAYLNGFGTPQAGALTLTGPVQSGNLNFGQVTSGPTKAITLLLSNQSSADSLAITVHRITSAPPFLSTNTCGLPLSSGQSCSITVSYAPVNQVASGTSSPASSMDTGLLTVESDASSSPDTVNLTGQAGPVSAAAPSDLLPIASFTLSQNSLTFPSTKVGEISPAQTLTLSNTGSIPLHLTSLAASAEFVSQSDCASVVAGGTCSITVTDSPTSTGTHVAALQIASDSTTSLEFVTLLSTPLPAALSLTPAALDFGSLLLHASSTQTVQVANTGPNPIIIGSIMADGDYTASSNCPPSNAALSPGQTCTVQITFTPLAIGVRTGTLSIVNSASTLPLTVSLIGTGIQTQLVVTPAQLNFGSIAVGTPASLPLILTNTGTAALTGIALTINGDFAVTPSCPATLAPAASCTPVVTFRPPASGPRTGTLTITSSDVLSPAAIPLAGTGVGGASAPTGSFTLTVNGGSASTLTVKAPSPAVFSLTLTPVGGFTGTVVLACIPTLPSLDTNCSLQPSTVTLTGAAQGATATVSTLNVVTLARYATLPRAILLCLLLPASLLLRRSSRTSRSSRTFSANLLLLAVCTLLASACGGGGNPNIHYTPPGSYQYQVTANSTSGPTILQSVTLNIVVQ